MSVPNEISWHRLEWLRLCEKTFGQMYSRCSRHADEGKSEHDELKQGLGRASKNFIALKLRNLLFIAMLST